LNLKLLACEILFRELCAAVARSINRIDIEFLPKGLHDIGQDRMRQRLQNTLAAVDQDTYDAVLFGYGLCSNGIVGLEANTVPLVIPRAHDCITFFLGSRHRYQDYFFANPGVYFKTSGWIERGDDLRQYGPESIQQKSGMMQSYDEMVAKYGEDNAQFLRAQLGDMTNNYSGLAYIEMGIEPDDRFERHARQVADDRGWRFQKLQGDMRLIQSLVDGPWDDERFLVVPPGHRVQPSFDENVVRAVPV